MQKCKRIQASVATALLATVISIDVQATWLTDFEGYSVFFDASGGGPNVNFAVWRNTDGNWLDEVWLASQSPTYSFNNATVGQEEFVYLYQVVASTLPADGESLSDFSVTFGVSGEVNNPFLGGGYISDTSFALKSEATSPVDTPDDGQPSQLVTVTPIEVDSVAVNPFSLSEIIIGNANVQGGLLYSAMRWNFFPTDIALDGYSSVLFLASDNRPNYSWADSLNDDGSNSAGDVPSARIPEPTTLVLLSFGIAGIGYQQRKQTIA